MRDLNAVYHRPPKKRVSMTLDQHREMVDLFKRGASVKHLADTYGYTLSGMKSKLQSMGYSQKGRM